MQDQNQNQTDNTNPPAPAAPAMPPAATPSEPTTQPEPAISPEPTPEPTPVVPDAEPAPEDAPADVAAKLNDARNILIALSSDPSVDDLSAAIGLSLCMDRTGKRATAIYSGVTPNALEFLKPEDTFESTTDTLQDFVIALDKEKADHLRYKLDGDYVKIYITPYHTRISEDDLEFSYGDFNIDLVVGLDIKNGTDLDSALREHGRVMHDAAVVNITTGTPGKFGETEWSDQNASSISEMVATLLYSIGRKIAIEKDEATALLTGIIAATDRFSAENTTPETMQVAAKLMASGADQKLITENISADFKDSFANLGSNDAAREEEGDTTLDINHEEESAPEPTPEPTSDTTPEPTPAPESIPAPTSPEPVSEPTLPEAPVLPTVPTELTTPAEPALEPATEPIAEPTQTTEANQATDFLSMPNFTALPSVEMPDLSTATPDLPDMGAEFKSEKVVAPSEDFTTEVEEGTNKYGQMLEDALNELNVGTPTVTPEMSAPAVGEGIGENIAPEPITNPAASIAPPVASNPEINGVPEINYMPLPGDEVLPPPPTPPIDAMGALPPMPDMSAPETAPIMPAPAITTPEPTAPAAPAPTDPSAFKIP